MAVFCPLFLACGNNGKIKINPDIQPVHETEDSVVRCDENQNTQCETKPSSQDDVSTPTTPATNEPNNVTVVERFPEPSKLGSQLVFYATYYFLPVVENNLGTFPLLSINGTDLGVSLSQRVWCDAAMEGSIGIKNEDGSYTTYNFAGTGSYEQVDCSPYYNHAPSERARFKKVDAPFGLGVNSLSLVPYRSIATSQAHIPTGSVVFIPEARGTIVVMPNGQKWEHDGYFMAADVGGKIESGHIDVFIGPATKNPFSFVTSNSKDKKTAYLVTDSVVKDKLQKQHQARTK